MHLTINTGADANVMPITFFNKLKLHRSILRTQHNTQLKSYTGEIFNILGTCMLKCYHSENSYNILFHVLNNNAQAILGLETSIALNLIKRIDTLRSNITEILNQILNEYSELFQGIGCINQQYHIILKDNAQPVVSPIRKVPLPLMDQLKSTIDDLERNNVVAKV